MDERMNYLKSPTDGSFEMILGITYFWRMKLGANKADNHQKNPKKNLYGPEPTKMVWWSTLPVK